MPFPKGNLYAVSNYSNMLSALRADRVGFGTIKGIILTADSCDDPETTFATVVKEIKQAGGYPVPASLGSLARVEGYPPIAVLTIPGIDVAGGLETLYYDDMQQRLPDIAADVQALLSSESCDVKEWNAEKQGKAHFAALVAASHKDDPSRAASAAFRTPPTVHIESSAFGVVARQIEDICKAMLAAG